MIIRKQELSPAPDIFDSLVSMGVKPESAEKMARCGGAQHLRLSWVEETETYLWATHREGTSQWVISDVTEPTDAESYTLLIQELVDEARKANFPIVKAQSYSTGGLLEKVVSQIGFSQLPPPIQAGPLFPDYPVPFGWILWIESPQKLTYPPYLRQRTDFTCGPTSLIMGSALVGKPLDTNLETELEIWRDSTYVMGADGFGLGTALQRRGIPAEVIVSQKEVILVGNSSGALTENNLREAIHQINLERVKQSGAIVRIERVEVAELVSLVRKSPVAILIDELILNGENAAHWILLWGIVDQYFLTSDPWTDNDLGETWVECAVTPISFSSLWEMASWGPNAGREMVVIGRKS